MDGQIGKLNMSSLLFQRRTFGSSAREKIPLRTVVAIRAGVVQYDILHMFRKQNCRASGQGKINRLPWRGWPLPLSKTISGRHSARNTFSWTCASHVETQTQFFRRRTGDFRPARTLSSWVVSRTLLCVTIYQFICFLRWRRYESWAVTAFKSWSSTQNQSTPSFFWIATIDVAYF